VSHPILELQADETLADQLRHRRQNLPEQDQLEAARAVHAEWARRRDGLQRRLEELDAEIARSESESHEIDLQRSRLEKQLKTVIAPREAEALMHEIALLNERRSGLDDLELAALEEQAAVDDDLQAMSGEEVALAAAISEGEEIAARAAADIDAQLAEIAARREERRAAVDSGQLARYDELRKHHVVAAAALNASRCDGCHLDLSASELDEVRATARDRGLADCPHCGRLLVV
jgi:predicted  nucleic acid-binding Zn-ribbon protein